MEGILFYMERLTEREYEVLKLVAQGFSNVEISQKIFVSTHTVKAHLESVYRKFKVDNRIRAIILAIQEDLIKPKDFTIEHKEDEYECCYVRT